MIIRTRLCANNHSLMLIAAIVNNAPLAQMNLVKSARIQVS